MIDLENEKLVTMTEAAKLLPRRPHTSTLWRWWRVGVRGCRLETVVCGGVRYTTREAMARFIRQLTEGNTAGHDEPTATAARRREQELERAERDCDRAGL